MSPPSRPLPPKKDVALALLQGPSLFIHLDPRKPEVLVPPYFKKQPQLVLQVGLNMAIPIPDLKVDDDGVTCTLSFNRKPFWCQLPWTAIFALVGEDMKGMVWPDEVPAEVAAQREPKQPAPVDAKAVRARPAREQKRRAAGDSSPGKKLAVVPGQSSSSAQQSSFRFGVPPSNLPSAASRSEASSPPPPAHGAHSPGGAHGPGAHGPGAQHGSGAPRVPPSRDDEAPKPPALPKHDSAKPSKRDLPPYLRIVK